ncbi:hypothetical protein FACS1894167_05360 [Synergistales bacterium]|nr:hypothetical protein FACS1894167_05360 [Synergistales bacterium]
MGNVLLCVPKDNNAPISFPAITPGIAYIAAYLRQQGINVFGINLNVFADSHLALESAIEEYNITAVGVGGLVVLWKGIKEVTDIVKQINSDIVTFIGGGLVTYSAKEAMSIVDTADYGIIGEGEAATAELLKSIYADGDVSMVSGIIYRNNKELCLTAPRDDFADIDLLPFPDYEIFGFKKIDYAPIVTARSCPYSCTFCSYSGGKKYRQRSLDSIFSEIEQMIQKYEITKINLSDELFSVNSERVFEFCKRITPLNLKWTASMRAGKHISMPLLKAMKESGCELLAFGLESADPTILKSMNKKITVEDIEKMVGLANEAGLNLACNVIFGDTEETMQTIKNTMMWTIEHNSNSCAIDMAMIKLFPGSPLYDKAVLEGKIPDTIKHIENGITLVNISRLSDEAYSNIAISAANVSPKRNYADIELGLKVSPDCKSYSITWQCPNCQSITKEDMLFQSLPREILMCDKCGRFYLKKLLDDYQIFADKELSLLLREKRCAFWGIGYWWQEIYERSSILKNTSFSYKLIDKKFNAVERVNGRIILPPPSSNDLSMYDFDVIICPTLNYELVSAIKIIAESAIPDVQVIRYFDIGLKS